MLDAAGVFSEIGGPEQARSKAHMIQMQLKLVRGQFLVCPESLLVSVPCNSGRDRHDRVSMRILLALARQLVTRVAKLLRSRGARRYRTTCAIRRVFTQ